MGKPCEEKIEVVYFTYARVVLPDGMLRARAGDALRWSIVTEYKGPQTF